MILLGDRALGNSELVMSGDDGSQARLPARWHGPGPSGAARARRNRGWDARADSLGEGGELGRPWAASRALGTSPRAFFGGSPASRGLLLGGSPAASEVRRPLSAAHAAAHRRCLSLL